MKSDDPNKVVTQWPKTANFVKTVSGWDIYFDTGVAQEPNSLRATVGVVSKMDALRVIREWPKLFNGNNACFANVTVDVINKAVNVTLNVDGEYALRFDVPGPEPMVDATEQNRMTAVFCWEGNLTSGVKSVPMVSHFAVLEDDRTVDAAMFVNKVVQFTANEDLEKLLQGFRDLAISINTGKPSSNAKTFEPINELLLGGFKPDQMQVIGAYKSTFESMIKNVYREGHTLIVETDEPPGVFGNNMCRDMYPGDAPVFKKITDVSSPLNDEQHKPKEDTSSSDTDEPSRLESISMNAQVHGRLMAKHGTFGAHATGGETTPLGYASKLQPFNAATTANVQGTFKLDYYAGNEDAPELCDMVKAMVSPADAVVALHNPYNHPIFGDQTKQKPLPVETLGEEDGSEGAGDTTFALPGTDVVTDDSLAGQSRRGPGVAEVAKALFDSWATTVTGKEPVPEASQECKPANDEQHGADTPADPPIRVNPMYLMTHEKREPDVNNPLNQALREAFEQEVMAVIDHDRASKLAEKMAYPRGKVPCFIYIDDSPWIARWVDEVGEDVKHDNDDAQKKETDKPDSDK